jgi:hypothetical protein
MHLGVLDVSAEMRLSQEQHLRSIALSLNVCTRRNTSVDPRPRTHGPIEDDKGGTPRAFQLCTLTLRHLSILQKQRCGLGNYKFRKNRIPDRSRSDDSCSIGAVFFRVLCRLSKHTVSSPEKSLWFSNTHVLQHLKRSLLSCLRFSKPSDSHETQRLLASKVRPPLLWVYTHGLVLDPFLPPSLRKTVDESLVLASRFRTKHHGPSSCN